MITNQVYTAHATPTNHLHTLTAPSYKPPTSKFRAGILKTKKGTVLIYPNGKAIVNKCRSLSDAQATARAVFSMTKIRITNFKLVNVVGCLKLARRVYIERINVPMSIYAPTRHSGLLMFIGNVSVIVYHTGTIMFAGCKSLTEYRSVLAKLVDMFINSPVDIHAVKDDVSHVQGQMGGAGVQTPNPN